MGAPEELPVNYVGLCDDSGVEPFPSGPELLPLLAAWCAAEDGGEPGEIVAEVGTVARPPADRHADPSDYESIRRSLAGIAPEHGRPDLSRMLADLERPSVADFAPGEAA